MDGNGSATKAQRRTRARMEGAAGAADDRLSALPDELLLHILSFCGIHCAILASRLSRRWRHLWHSLPSLSFSTCKRWRSLDHSLTWLIDRILLHHAAPRIDRFILPMSSRDQAGKLLSPEIDSWLLFAVRRGVRVLRLDFMMDEHLDPDYLDPAYAFADPVYGLPPCLLSCGSLEALDARFCHLDLHGGVRLGSLKTMRLSLVTFCDDDLEILLCGCPLLQSLKLVGCNITSNLYVIAGGNRHLEELEVYEGFYYFTGKLGMEICAPSVKRLSFRSVPRNWYRVRDDLSSLVEASFDFDESLDRESYNLDFLFGNFESFADFLEHVGHVQVLKLGSRCLQALSARVVKGLRVSSCFSVTSLELSIGMQKRELPGIFRVFKACSKLSMLTINIHSKKNIQFNPGFLDECPFDETAVRSFTLFFHNVMQHLKAIKIQVSKECMLVYQLKEGTSAKLYIPEDSIFYGYNEKVTGREEEESEVADYCIPQKYKAFILFIGFLFKVSPILEKLIIQTSRDMNEIVSKLLFKLSLDLQSLPRASPNAQVIIKKK